MRWVQATYNIRYRGSREGLTSLVIDSTAFVTKKSLIYKVKWSFIVWLTALELWRFKPARVLLRIRSLFRMNIVLTNTRLVFRHKIYKNLLKHIYSKKITNWVFCISHCFIYDLIIGVRCCESHKNRDKVYKNMMRDSQHKKSNSCFYFKNVVWIFCSGISSKTTKINGHWPWSIIIFIQDKV